MVFLLSLISPHPFIDPPRGFWGWVVFIFLFALICVSLYNWRNFRGNFASAWGRKQVIVFTILCLATPLTTLFFGLQGDPTKDFFGASGVMPPPGLPMDPIGPEVMLFAAIPWIIAGGLFGPLPAAALGAFSGLLTALWGTHSPFTPLTVTLFAIWFSVIACQRYRTRFFQILRQPLIAVLLLALIYPLLYLITAPFTSQFYPTPFYPVTSSLVVQLDYAMITLPTAWLAMTMMLLFAGAVAQVVKHLLPMAWGGRGPLRPSPAERSLQVRFFYSIAPIGVLLVITLLVGCWIVAGSVARDMLQNQMRTTVKTVAEQLPYYLETGQTLIAQLSADPRLSTTPADQMEALLAELIKSGTFFSQLVVLDQDTEVVAAYPDYQYIGSQAPVQEQIGLQLALSGFPFQYHSIPPRKNGTTAQTSFIVPLKDPTNSNLIQQPVKRVLIGRVDLGNNPYTHPLVNSLSELRTNYSGIGWLNSTAMILDENHDILTHPDVELLMTEYGGRTDSPDLFYDEIGPDGSRMLVYYRAVNGYPWSVVMTVPMQAAQQLSLRIAAPLLGMIAILAILALIVLNMSVRMVTNSLESLAGEAEAIAKGKLDQPLPIEGEDEVGLLRKAFEKMRLSLKARLEELNQLLMVSQGVAANLEMPDAVEPVLESALTMGACLARVALVPAVVPELNGSPAEPIIYSVGTGRSLYNDLDEQILALTRQKERLILSNLTRPRLLVLAPELPHPASIIAFALRHENQYYGSMWVAYDQPHTFPEDEVRFLATLASQAAIAAANARLFMTAEIGRQRLAAILASSPDPVLVTNQHNHLILANPAAWQILGTGPEAQLNRPIEQVVTQKALLDLLLGGTVENRSTEITIGEGKTYLAAVSSVEAEGQRVGRVCVLRDVTQFKELDALKSEFVATVSHDLRTPLALMRGYATMMEMVGQLNEQQLNYVRKILGGVETMSRLVNNLLDLGRIEAGVGLQTEIISVYEIVERVVNTLQIQATQKKIQIRTEFPSQGETLEIEADSALIQQALSNLVENAIKFTRNEGKITIRIQPQAERVVFEVSDTGVGISPMDQPRLFEKFYRSPQPVAPENQGSGLGLAIVRSITERHSGQVWMESQLGKGSTFYMAIPYRQVKT